MSRVLLDTSAFIAGVDGELDLSSFPGEATIPLLTLDKDFEPFQGIEIVLV